MWRASVSPARQGLGLGRRLLAFAEDSEARYDRVFMRRQLRE